jgi:hypothetical protein
MLVLLGKILLRRATRHLLVPALARQAVLYVTDLPGLKLRTSRDSRRIIYCTGTGEEVAASGTVTVTVTCFTVYHRQQA